MNSWFRFKKRRRELDVERELRAARPQAPDSFVRALAARINPRPARPVRTRTRVAVAAVVTASLAAVLGATGGFSSAASSVSSLTSGVAHVTGIASTPSSTSGPHSSACAQYAVAPTITDFSPTAGKAGTLVTVHGTNFTGPSAITEVDLGAEAVSFTVTSSTSLTFAVPADAAGGDQSITVTNCPGFDSSGPFTVYVTPTISAINPTSGGYGTVVAITGSGLTSTSSVKFFGGKVAAFTFVDDTEVDATVPVGAKTGAITVTNAAGSATTPTFTVTLTAPTVSSFTPLIGEVGTTVTITGTGFDDSAPGATTVSFNGTDATTVNVASATSLTADVPVGATSGKITVTTGGGAATSAKAFTVVGTPEIDSFKPTIGVAGTTSVTILGHSFTGTTHVLFNTTEATPFAVKGDTQITVKVPAGATTGPIHVTNNVGTGDSATDFTVIQPPDITGVAPGSGGYGVPVTITGTGFSGVTKVTFNAKPAKFTVASDTEIDTTVPAGAKDTGTGITVTNVKGSSTFAFNVVLGGPTLTKFAPTSGAEGENVLLTGTNLKANLTVTFGSGSSVAKDNTGGSATSVSVTIPAGAETGPITVDNGVGLATSKASFTVLAAPVIVGFTPAFGKVGTKVTIVGDHLIGATEVDFGGASSIAKPSYNKKDGSLSVSVPKTAVTGTITVKVKTPAGNTLSGDSGNSDIFTLVTVKPTIDDLGTPFSPSEAVAGTDVTITGTGFIGPMSVKFNGKVSPFVSVTDSTHLVARVPAGATSGVVMVSNIAGPYTSKTKLLITAITAFSPTKGLAGKVVTITGTHLLGATDVSFDGTSATISSNSDTKIVVTVPIGATTGFITVTTSAGTATSAKQFTVG